MIKYRIREERYEQNSLFIPEVKTGWWSPWKQWYTPRGGDDPDPPQVNFSSLSDAQNYLKKEMDRNNPINIIHSLE